VAVGGTVPVVAGEEVVADGEDSNRLSEIPQESRNGGWISSPCDKMPTATFLHGRSENGIDYSNRRNEISESADGAS
jgi:hypothetical protein